MPETPVAASRQKGLAYVFEPFYYADNVQFREAGGTDCRSRGLGIGDTGSLDPSKGRQGV